MNFKKRKLDNMQKLDKRGLRLGSAIEGKTELPETIVVGWEASRQRILKGANHPCSQGGGGARPGRAEDPRK